MIQSILHIDVESCSGAAPIRPAASATAAESTEATLASPTLAAAETATSASPAGTSAAGKTAARQSFARSVSLPLGQTNGHGDIGAGIERGGASGGAARDPERTVVRNGVGIVVTTRRDRGPPACIPPQIRTGVEIPSQPPINS